MKKIITSCLLIILMGCSKDNEITNEAIEPPIEQPVPEGAKEVTIIVEEPYNLKDSEAQSLMDSSPMDGEINKIAIPNSFESATFFLKEGTDEVLAVVRTSPSNNTIKVNANTVAQALLTLVPSYHSLTKTLRDKFENEAPSVKLYQDFVATVDILLKDGKTVYSSDPEFINQIVNLHVFINETYLGIPDEESNGRDEESGNLGKQNQGDFDFSNWMKRDGGGTVTNNVHSYVYINFEPLSGGEMVSKLLNPEPYDPREESEFTLASLGLKDDCYKVNINQTHYDATSQNILATATTFVGLFFDVIFGYMPGQDKNACIAAITGSIITDVSTTVLNATNLTAWDLVDKTGEAVWNGLKAGANQPNCLNFITPQKIMLALGQQSAVMLQVVKGINITSKSLDILGYLYPFVDPVEINEVFQLYDGKLKEACVKAVDDETLKEEYGPGEIVYPGIEIKAQSQYAEWVKSGFKVKWVVASNNGSVNLPTSETNNEGKATVAWTLPENVSGQVSLKAELLDKEGDHLTGSPVEFMTNVTECNSSGYQLQIGNYSSDYNSSTVLSTITKGERLTIPNYMAQFLRLTYNGVSVSTGNGNQWTSRVFGSQPNSSADIIIDDYNIELYDFTNSRNVCFEVDLVLTNKAYERIVEKTVNISRYMYYGEVYYENIYTVHFRNDGTYSQKNNGSNEIKNFSYSFTWDYNYRTQPCLASEITKPVVGVIKLHTELGNGFWPNFIMIYEDGTLSSNGPQACTDWFDYFVIQ